MQGRVEQAHRDRQPVHGGEDGDEVLALDEAQLLERVGLLGRRVGQDHAAHHRQAVLAQEHVLGAAQPDALGAELPRVGGVLAGVHVGPDGQVALADVVGPREDDVEGGRGLGRRQRHLARHDDPGPAVEGHPVALEEGDVVRAHLVVAQAQHLGADDGRLAPAPRHDRRMAHQTAPRGQDPLGGQHAVHVLGRGLVAHQDDLLAAPGRLGGVVGAEVDPTHGRPGARPEALGPRGVARTGELGVQHGVEVVLGEARHGLGLGDPEVARAHHVDGHLEGRRAGALADPGLEHPELALLDGELGVAHVAVVRFEAVEDLEQLGVDLGELLLQLRDRLGVADAGDDVLTLRVDQEVAVGALGTRGGVAGEADARARVVVAVAEDHGLDVDGGAEVVRDVLALAVGDGARPVPAAEHRLDGPTQLLGGRLGERLAGVALDDLLVGVDEIAQQLDGDLGVRRRPGQLLGRVEERVELLAGQLEDDAGVHGDEAPVRVEGEALVTGLLRQPLDGAVVEAQVQDGVHHAGHGELGPRAHRDQQGVLGVADGLAHGGLEPALGRRHLGVEGLGPATGHVVAAGVGRDGEPRGTGSSSTDVISARLAPLPPRRSFSSIGGRGCVWSKSKTYGIGPPCPGRAKPRWRARSLGTPPNLGRGCSAPTFPPGPPPEAAAPPATWCKKTSLAWRMKSRTTASSSALKRWATSRISSATGCCSTWSRCRASGTISTHTRRRSSVSRRRVTMPAPSSRSRMKVTAPVVSPLSSASRPAVIGPRRPIRSRQRMSVLLSFSFLASPSLKSLAAPRYPMISLRSCWASSARDHCLDT